MEGLLSWLFIFLLFGFLFWTLRKKVEGLSLQLTNLERRINNLDKLVGAKLKAAPYAAVSREAAQAIPPEVPRVPPPIPPEPDVIEPEQPGPQAAPPPGPDAPPARPSPPAFNWERFMGVKLLAWVGCLALFLSPSGWAR